MKYEEFGHAERDPFIDDIAPQKITPYGHEQLLFDLYGDDFAEEKRLIREAFLRHRNSSSYDDPRDIARDGEW